MPSVFTIEGTDRKQCKTVTNKKTGCSVQLCFVGKSKKHRSGWKFMKGTTRCSSRR